MKKQIVVAAGIALLSTPAFATKARMEALGQSSNTGSYFLSDTRNVFKNPAYVNEYSNYIVTEWGTANANSSTSADPGAEGGFFKSMGNFNYGLYLGSDQNSYNANTLRDTYLDRDNEIDLFFAGDAGVQWGVNIGYASNEDEDTVTNTVAREQDYLGINVGVLWGQLEGYLNFDVKDESEGTTGVSAADKFESSGFKLGGSYDWKKHTFYVTYDDRSLEDAISGGNVTEDEITELRFGWGYKHKVNDKARLISEAYYETIDTERTVTGAAVVEYKQTRLPVLFGFEVDANSWLTLRGSVKQNFVIGETEGDSTLADNTRNAFATSETNSTDVAAGATLNFGKLMVDGMIGTTSAAGTEDEDGRLRTEDLLTRVAVHYWF